MSAVMLAAVGAGAGLGLGLTLLVLGLRRPSSLQARLAPWVSDISTDAARMVIARERGRGQGLLARRVVQPLARGLGRVVVRDDKVVRQLAQSGFPDDLAQWRSQLVEAVLLGALAGAVVGAAAAWFGSMGPVALAALIVLGGFGGFAVRRWSLARRAAKRVAVMREELPALAELLALCLASGQSFSESLTRIVSRGDGPLCLELQQVARHVQLGLPLADALNAMTSRLGVPEVTRTFDQVLLGIDRGTPMATVLRTLADESRRESARRLQEKAATREVAMLVPLIFVILPVTVAFAIFPGLLVIQAGF